MKSWEDIEQDMVDTYDAKAESSQWFGPDAAFGLAFGFVKPGQSLLELGIGTGLGSSLFRKAGLNVHGMDISEKMLQACRDKGLKNLTQHDLGNVPYPFPDASMDHALCTGVLNFFADPSAIFRETSRIIRTEGTFTFLVLDRAEHEPPEILIRDHQPDEALTFFRHSHEQVETVLSESGLTPFAT